MATIFGIVGVLASCCVVQIGIRARQEEAHGTAETVLATPVPRIRWLAEYWIVGVVATIVVLAAAALAGLLGALSAEDPGALASELVQAAAAQLPATLVFLGLTLLVFAALPRSTIPLAWTLVGLAAILGVFGPLLGAPEWLVDASPFTHSPVPAGDEVDWTGGFWMIGIGIVAAAIAVAAMRRREVIVGG
jgi:ABC-2 type transport system permease protein